MYWEHPLTAIEIVDVPPATPVAIAVSFTVATSVYCEDHTPQSVWSIGSSTKFGSMYVTVAWYCWPSATATVALAGVKSMEPGMSVPGQKPVQQS
jgi:hypothetical protein